MKGICLGAMVAAALCLGGPARAASNTTLGVGSGAVAGALVGGPIGAVAGAIVGQVMKATRGKADPGQVNKLIAAKLAE